MLVILGRNGLNLLFKYIPINAAVCNQMSVSVPAGMNLCVKNPILNKPLTVH